MKNPVTMKWHVHYSYILALYGTSHIHLHAVLRVMPSIERPCKVDIMPGHLCIHDKLYGLEGLIHGVQ